MRAAGMARSSTCARTRPSIGSDRIQEAKGGGREQQYQEGQDCDAIHRAQWLGLIYMDSGVVFALLFHTFLM